MTITQSITAGVRLLWVMYSGIYRSGFCWAVVLIIIALIDNPPYQQIVGLVAFVWGLNILYDNNEGRNELVLDANDRYESLKYCLIVGYTYKSAQAIPFIAITCFYYYSELYLDFPDIIQLVTSS